jgi:hypothetical protein
MPLSDGTLLSASDNKTDNEELTARDTLIINNES